MAQGYVAGQTTNPSVGQIVQFVYTQSGAVATGTTTIPYDDTIPQNTEGDQYLTASIIPTSVSSILEINVSGFWSSSSGNVITVALFQDSTANAIAAMPSQEETTVTIGNPIGFSYRMVAGTISSTTFKVRVGNSSAATITFNGDASARKLGGVIASSITITEIKA